VYTKYHSNQSLFTQLSLYSIIVILIFTTFSCFSSKYITEWKQYCARLFWRLLYNAQL